jgi:predicted house-cleaning noncanonical NTP pyrophosphatase (MazG superfamily)
MKYNKLVRDKIPEIMADNGAQATFTVLDKEKYQYFLEMKLDEEVNEYHESHEAEELADILEVVYALGRAAGYSINRLNDLCRKKNKKKGSFDKRICMLKSEEIGGDES